MADYIATRAQAARVEGIREVVEPIPLEATVVFTAEASKTVWFPGMFLHSGVSQLKIEKTSGDTAVDAVDIMVAPAIVLADGTVVQNQSNSHAYTDLVSGGTQLDHTDATAKPYASYSISQFFREAGSRELFYSLEGLIFYIDDHAGGDITATMKVTLQVG